MGISNHFESGSYSTDKVIKQKYLTQFQRKTLHKILQEENLPQKYRQRIEIMLLADEGKTQSQISEMLGCSRVTVRHWVLVAKSGEAHNWEDFPLGRPKTVNDDYRERLKEIVSRSPKEFGYSFRHWTAQWLSKHLASELGVEVGIRHINRLLKEMGLSTRSKAKKTVNCNEEGSKRLIIDDLTNYPKPNNELCRFNSIR